MHMLNYLQRMSWFFNKNDSSMNIGCARKGLGFWGIFFSTYDELANNLFLQITSWAILQPQLQEAKINLHGLVVSLSHYLKHHMKSRSPVKRCWDQVSLKVGVKETLMLVLRLVRGLHKKQTHPLTRLWEEVVLGTKIGCGRGKRGEKGHTHYVFVYKCMYMWYPWTYMSRK